MHDDDHGVEDNADAERERDKPVEQCIARQA